MGRLCAPRTWAALFIGVGIGCCGARARAAELAGFVPAPPGQQFMLYVSRAIGVRGAAANAFGLRYERATPVAGDAAARFCAPLRHRALVDLQFRPGFAPRMQFGSNVTWDLARGQLYATHRSLPDWPLAVRFPSPAPLAAWVP